MMELMEFIHAKIIGFWWCPNIKEVLFKTKINLIEVQCLLLEISYLV